MDIAKSQKDQGKEKGKGKSIEEELEKQAAELTLGKEPTPPEATEDDDGFQRFLKKFSPQIVEQLVKDNQKVFKDVPYVYDGQKNFYTSKTLTLQDAKGTKDMQTFKVKVDFDGGKPGFYNIKMKRVERIDLSEVVQFYQGKTNTISERSVSIFEMAFRFIFGRHYESYQRKFFDLNDAESSPKVCQ